MDGVLRPGGHPRIAVLRHATVWTKEKAPLIEEQEQSNVFHFTI